MDEIHTDLLGDGNWSWPENHHDGDGTGGCASVSRADPKTDAFDSHKSD